MKNILKLTRKYQFSQLTKGQKEFYDKNGYLILEKVLSNQQIDSLVERTDQLVEESDIINNSIFFTADNSTIQRGMSFIETASKIGFLLEMDSVDENNKLKVPSKKLALNKIGHAMHDIDAVYERFSYNKTFKDILRDLGYQTPVLTQSMYIFKNQRFGSKVDMHTDNTYMITRPNLSCMGVWCALEDANKTNGCMYAFPGSHKIETDYFMVMDKDKKSTSYVGPKPNYEQKYPQKEAVCLEVPKGTVIALHGDLVHYSGPNQSPLSRYAYTMHFVELGKGNHWSPESWLQREPELPLRDYNSVVDALN